MNFSKVKLLICLCLLLVNVIFFMLCVRLTDEKNYLSEEEAALAEKNLSGNGMNVNIDKELRKLYDLPVYSAEIAPKDNYISEIYKNITESFFGIKVDDEAYVNTPNGYSVSVKDKDGNVLGSSSVKSELEFECSYENAGRVNEVSAIFALEDGQTLDRKECDEYTVAQSFIDLVLKNYGMNFVFSGTKNHDGGKVVYFTGELSDTRVADIYINFYVKNGNILSCNGRITDKAPQKKYSSKLIDSIDALYILYDYICDNADKKDVLEITVTDMNLEYRTFRYDIGKYYIIPTWVMEYTDINGKSFRADTDAVTGSNITVTELG